MPMKWYFSVKQWLAAQKEQQEQERHDEQRRVNPQAKLQDGVERARRRQYAVKEGRHLYD